MTQRQVAKDELKYSQHLSKLGKLHELSAHIHRIVTSSRNLQNSPSRQFPSQHHLTELVDVVQRAFCENGVHQVSGGEIESAGKSQHQRSIDRYL